MAEESQGPIKRYVIKPWPAGSAQRDSPTEPVAIPEPWRPHSPAEYLQLFDENPPVVFPERTFCFTGKAAYGPRSKCEREVIRRGGKILDSINWHVNYLVVGALAIMERVYSSKFEQAVDVRVRKRNEKSDYWGDLYIISEEHWIKYL